MDIQSPGAAVLLLLLLLVAFGAGVVAAAQTVAARFGRRGLLIYWLASSVSLAAVAGAWFASEFPRTGELWGVFLTPFLFLATTIGAVAWYLASARAGRGRQFAIGLLVFVAAAVPGVIVAQIPDLIYFNW